MKQMYIPPFGGVLRGLMTLFFFVSASEVPFETGTFGKTIHNLTTIGAVPGGSDNFWIF